MSILSSDQHFLILRNKNVLIISNKSPLSLHGKKKVIESSPLTISYGQPSQTTSNASSSTRFSINFISLKVTQLKI